MRGPTPASIGATNADGGRGPAGRNEDRVACLVFRSADLPLRLTSCDHLYSRGVVVAVPRYRVFRPSAGANRACFLTESDHRFSEATADVRRSWCNYVPLPVPLFALPVRHFSSSSRSWDPYSALRVPADRGQPMPFCWVVRKKTRGHRFSPRPSSARACGVMLRDHFVGSGEERSGGEAERLAVLSLITSSIMVACCTGRSAGFCAVASIASRTTV